MKKIIDVAVISDNDRLDFEKGLKYEIDMIQRQGYEVEIKYSTSTYANYNTEYSALVLTIEEE